MCVLPEYMESDNLKLKLQMVVTTIWCLELNLGALEDFKS